MAEKKIQIASTIPVEQHKRLKAIRWAAKYERLSDVLRDAVNDFVAKHDNVKNVATDK